MLLVKVFWNEQTNCIQAVSTDGKQIFMPESDDDYKVAAQLCADESRFMPKPVGGSTGSDGVEYRIFE